MTAGAFSERDRATIYARSDGRCVGCGASSPLTAQHRRARGMGGSKGAGGHANGVALCGSGTTGCHGWAEAHPLEATLLGWRLGPDEHNLEAPYFDRVYGWRRIEPDGGHAYVHPDELDRRLEREDALVDYRRHLNQRDKVDGVRRLGILR